MQREDIRLPFGKQTVRDAPRVEASEELSSEEERRLFEHYGMSYDGGDGYREAMTRSEEEMRVGTEQRERGRARLRKYAVTEREQVTVPVRHEEARIEREPISGDEARSGGSISEDEQEMTLHEERPVAETEVVPKERVRMGKETRRDEETVSRDMRKERIKTEDDTDRYGNR
jgi:uncharacterized protein (TIGR02271 family)